MALYKISKQITKFTISGVIAVMFDFTIYYLLSNVFKGAIESNVSVLFGLGWNDVFKGIGFLGGSFVTYNLNKFWTWRQTDKNNTRLKNFFILYAFSFIANIIINRYFLNTIPNQDLAIIIRDIDGTLLKELIAIKVDKLAAFFIATVCSSVITFTGQKLWIFKPQKT